jgi:NAD(P)-dependent dehydrogenase (short-subunit alcohol dehydrogenase family)
MKDLYGKVAFVTGGDSGIGLGISSALLRAGMNLIISYLNPSHLRRAQSELKFAADQMHAIRLDVSDRTAYNAAAEEAIQRFGKLHVLVNNAGVWPTASLGSASFDDFDWCMSVNVNGVFNGIRTLLPHITAHGEGGHVVSTASVTGLVAAPFWGVYTTSKFAVVGMMESLRAELEGSNVGVSVFCPGAVISSIGQSARNRPQALPEVGKPNASESEKLESYGKALREVVFEAGISRTMLSAADAGEMVLRGILNNDLYILSHPEYKSAVQQRGDALDASLPTSLDLTDPRLSIARLSATSIYSEEVVRRRGASSMG